MSKADDLRGLLATKAKAQAVPITGPPAGYDGLDGEFHMRRMSGQARDSWQQWFRANSTTRMDSNGTEWLVPSPTATHFTARRVARSLCSPDGTLLYDFADEDKIRELSAIDDVVLQWLDDAITAYNGLGPQAEKEAEKNSESAPSLQPGIG